MIVAVGKETYPGERRVALTPSVIGRMVKKGGEIQIEAGAGEAAGFSDADYQEAGATTISSRDELFAADVVLQVRSLGANLEQGRDDLARMRPGQILLGMCDPLGEPKAIAEIANTGASLLALEMIPRTTRAQSMDVLSSMATIAGYRAVLIGAVELPTMCPMITYAAGMLRPARVFVIGVGVAGLRAIATAKSLGAVVSAHDIRPSSKEEVQSVGAKFVELDLGGDTQDAGGYAKKLTDADYQRQRELIAEVCSESDLVITTAAIPGRTSPLLITADAVAKMPQGSVIVDLAAERGGNCELSQADSRVEKNGVTILGPTNLPSEIPSHASQMLANNLDRLLGNMLDDGKIVLNRDDDITCETLVAHGGEVVHPRIRSILDLPPLETEIKEEEAKK